MTLHPLDPAGGYLVHHDNGQSAIVEMANGLLIEGYKVSWSHGDYAGPTIAISYAHRIITAQRTNGENIIPAQGWATNNFLGAIPLHPDDDVPFAERFRRSLADAFGPAPQARLQAVLTLARLRQDTMGWADADLVLNAQYPRGLLRTQIGGQKFSTILLKADRGRKPPELDAFLGSACQLCLPNIPQESARILRRPKRAGPRLDTCHSRIAAVYDLISLFAEHGIDLSPWQDDLLA